MQNNALAETKPVIKQAIQQRKHPRNTHETLTRARDHHLETRTDSERAHIIGQISHCSNFLFKIAGWTDGPDGRTGRTHPTNSRAQPQPQRNHLAHAASLARTHATQSQPKPKSISQFGGRTNVALITPNSDGVEYGVMYFL